MVNYELGNAEQGAGVRQVQAAPVGTILIPWQPLIPNGMTTSLRSKCLTLALL